MTNDHRIAAELRQLFGVEAGVRLSAAAIAGALHARTVYANRVSAREAAFDLMWNYEARGLVDDCPGPRGGAGWSLSARGAALIARSTVAPDPVR
ncbi:hypothetical protein ATE67_20420 [Sphingopyxis sp. H050]|uniref:hypothetical protein n=1 Tax=unclassified Sphingopyxis TaxID=2614943 RepID=UPI0007368077|nr:MULTISPECIES: hypothetical protein [unclassified Sphingopyxis]KTE04050.1 hypothetical protein ATE71_19310 [Sphingopyxis sp. H115]KTE04948.1 hypothetical protein ATE76_22540 [Sphingopyxis sp. H093]KTE17936.1 hypothetical protein ATE67_20420 [Sphingopyxis sp. H050]KTE60376.1 hypothetical protein ATE74_22360 [Sphingopyxis sp. H085]